MRIHEDMTEGQKTPTPFKREADCVKDKGKGSGLVQESIRSREGGKPMMGERRERTPTVLKRVALERHETSREEKVWEIGRGGNLRRSKGRLDGLSIRPELLEGARRYLARSKL